MKEFRLAKGALESFEHRNKKDSMFHALGSKGGRQK
jgi:hypothetical protein